MNEILKNQSLELETIADLESEKLLNKKNKIMYMRGTESYMEEYLALFNESILSLNNLLAKKVEDMMQEVDGEDTINITEYNRYIYDYCKKLTKKFIAKHG